MTENDPLPPRWRRLDQDIVNLRRAVKASDADQIPVEVGRIMDAMYGLWEMWTSTAGLNFKEQNRRVCGDDDGETAAALMAARGAGVHSRVNWGRYLGLGFGQGRFGEGPFGGGPFWMWQQDDAGGLTSYSPRDQWFAAHVARRSILRPIDSAYQWLVALPELTT